MIVDFHPSARHDIDRASEEIAEDLGAGAARLFQIRLLETIDKLSRIPRFAALHEPGYPRVPGLRIVPVLRFKGRIVCYRVTATGIEVLRVLHSSRDLDALFGS